MKLKLLILSTLLSGCGWFKEQSKDGKGDGQGQIRSPAFSLVQPSNQVVWYKVETGYVNGDPAATQLIDATSPQLNTASQLTAANQPKLIPYSPLGDVSSLSFDGDDYFTLPIAGDINATSFMTKTLVMSFRTGSDVTSRQYLWEQGNSPNGLSLYIFDGRLYAAAWRESGSYISAFLSTPIKPNESYTAGWVFDYPQKEFVGYINGARFAAHALTTYSMASHAYDVTLGNSQSSRTEIGTDPRFTVGFKGYFGELNYYKVALTSAEMQTQHNYLASKWHAFSPKGLDQLAFWYTSKKAEFLVGSPNLEQWKDVSTNALDTVVQTDDSRKPALVPNAIHSTPALQFQGQTRIELPIHKKIGSEPYLSRSLALVFKTGSDVTTTQYLYEQGNLDSGLSLYISDKKLYAACWNGVAHNVFVSDYLEANRTFTAGFVLDGTVQAFSGFMNKRAFATAPIAGLQPAEAGHAMLGFSNTTRSRAGLDVTGAGFQGLMAEVVYYERALDLSEMQQLQQYMIDGWDINTAAVPLPPEVSAAMDEETQPEIASKDDFFDEEIGQPLPALEEEYKKVADIGIDPSLPSGSGPATPAERDPEIFDPDEPSTVYPMCDASGQPIPGSSGTGGAESGSSTPSGTVVLSPRMDPVSNEGELFERMAELEVFAQAGDNPGLAVTTTKEDLENYARSLESARTELFLAYMRQYAASGTDLERCRMITRAARLLTEIQNGVVRSGYESIQQTYQNLSPAFKDAVMRKDVCNALSLDPTVGMKTYIRNAIASRLEAEVITSVHGLESFVAEQIKIFKELKDKMEVTLNTEGVLRQKRDIQNIRSNLEMVVGPKAEKVDNTIEDFMGIDRKIGAAFNPKDLALTESGGLVNETPWLDLERSIVCRDANGLPVMRSDSDLIVKIACLDTVVAKGGKHPALADLENRIVFDPDVGVSYRNQIALNLIASASALADQGKTSEAEKVAPKCEALSRLYQMDRTDPITKESGLAKLDEQLRTFAASENIDLNSANKVDLRKRLVELYKSKYNYCLNELSEHLGTSMDDDAVKDKYIKQFSELLLQYSEELLIQKKWHTRN